MFTLTEEQMADLVRVVRVYRNRGISEDRLQRALCGHVMHYASSWATWHQRPMPSLGVLAAWKALIEVYAAE